MKSRAAVAFGPGLPLEIVEIDVAPPKKGEVRAHLVALPTQAATPPRLLALLSFVRISMNNLRCCIRIMVRISLCNPRSMKSLILMSSMALN